LIRDAQLLLNGRVLIDEKFCHAEGDWLGRTDQGTVVLWRWPASTMRLDLLKKITNSAVPYSTSI
jgi:hypothetical protein